MNEKEQGGKRARDSERGYQVYLISQIRIKTKELLRNKLFLSYITVENLTIRK